MSRPATGLSGRLCALLMMLAATPVALVVAGGSATAPSGSDGTVGQDATEVLARGAELYALNCAVCHGRTGGGLPEAKLAFPEDHRDCTRCHRPSNRIVQPLTEPFVDNDMFAVGDPPAVRPIEPAAGDEVAAPDLQTAVAGRLGSTADPTAILAYVTATMPRYDPGRLTDDEYLAITAHLLALNDRSDEVDEFLRLARD